MAPPKAVAPCRAVAWSAVEIGARTAEHPDEQGRRACGLEESRHAEREDARAHGCDVMNYAGTMALFLLRSWLSRMGSSAGRSRAGHQKQLCTHLPSKPAHLPLTQ